MELVVTIHTASHSALAIRNCKAHAPTTRLSSTATSTPALVSLLARTTHKGTFCRADSSLWVTHCCLRWFCAPNGKSRRLERNPLACLHRAGAALPSLLLTSRLLRNVFLTLGRRNRLRFIPRNLAIIFVGHPQAQQRRSKSSYTRGYACSCHWAEFEPSPIPAERLALTRRRVTKNCFIFALKKAAVHACSVKRYSVFGQAHHSATLPRTPARTTLLRQLHRITSVSPSSVDQQDAGGLTFSIVTRRAYSRLCFAPSTDKRSVGKTSCQHRFVV